MKTFIMVIVMCLTVKYKFIFNMKGSIMCFAFNFLVRESHSHNLNFDLLNPFPNNFCAQVTNLSCHVC